MFSWLESIGRGILQRILNIRAIRFPLIFLYVFVGLIGFSGHAFAINAVTSANVNMRSGPSISYAVIRVLPGSAGVRIHNCLKAATWCDVSYAESRGWVSGEFLLYTGGVYVRRPLIYVYSYIDVPIYVGRPPIYWPPNRPKPPVSKPPRKIRPPISKPPRKPKRRASSNTVRSRGNRRVSAGGRSRGGSAAKRRR